MKQNENWLVSRATGSSLTPRQIPAFQGFLPSGNLAIEGMVLSPVGRLKDQQLASNSGVTMDSVERPNSLGEMRA